MAQPSPQARLRAGALGPPQGAPQSPRCPGPLPPGTVARLLGTTHKDPAGGRDRGPAQDPPGSCSASPIRPLPSSGEGVGGRMTLAPAPRPTPLQLRHGHPGRPPRLSPATGADSGVLWAVPSSPPGVSGRAGEPRALWGEPRGASPAGSEGGAGAGQPGRGGSPLSSVATRPAARLPGSSRGTANALVPGALLSCRWSSRGSRGSVLSFRPPAAWAPFGLVPNSKEIRLGFRSKLVAWEPFRSHPGPELTRTNPELAQTVTRKRKKKKKTKNK